MNNIRPKIGVPAPTSIDVAYNQRSWPAYAEAIAEAGGEPVPMDIGLPETALQSLAGECHAFLLPGSPADVDPGLYDTPRIPACGPQDASREAADFLLLRHALETRKPVFGICYGCQSINTFFGGTLIQDLSPLPVNHAAGSAVAVAHTVLVEGTSLLGSILLADKDAAMEAMPARDTLTPAGFLRLPVNTSHHQAVVATGARMRPVARCPDDEVIEAIEPTAMFHVEHPAFLLGVQWHPERSTSISPASRALFARFVTEAELFATGVGGPYTHTLQLAD